MKNPQKWLAAEKIKIKSSLLQVFSWYTIIAAVDPHTVSGTFFL
jgi:hypothetical protein